MKPKTTVLILGITGMLGSTLFRVLSKDQSLRVYGTARNSKANTLFAKSLSKNILTLNDIQSDSSIRDVFHKTQPDIVINCIGLIKQIDEANQIMWAIPINSVLPHRLALLTKEIGAHLLLISTDCVFSGKKGNYKESDRADCSDLYGQSKFLGEIANEKHVLTIRTSIIGHELRGGHSLVNWFLKQKGSVRGYCNAIYSGLPTVELANIIRNLIAANIKKFNGLYQIASKPISKFELLHLIANAYNKKIAITKANLPKINRSLSYNKFKKQTGYRPKSWEQLIDEMYADYLQSKFTRHE
jgi:dTDP-4-dehydrorhamnose reductase